MKKAAVVTVMALTLSFFSPIMQQAQAASLEDTLAQVNALDASKVQELLNAKQMLEQSDKKVILGAIANTAIERAAQSKAVNSIVSNVATSDMISTLANSNINNLKSVVRGQVEQQIGNRLTDYQDELDIVAKLLNSKGGILSPNSVSESNTLAGSPENYKQVINMTATAYGPGPLDNGKWGNLTYMGGTVKQGVAAVDPRVIPMGSKLWVDGYGYAIAEDQGSAIKGNRIDLAFNNRTQALDYGIQNVKVYVLE